MVSEPLTLSCKIDVEDDFMEQYDMIWKECTWTRISDNSGCRVTAIYDDNDQLIKLNQTHVINEKKCDKSLSKVIIDQSADRSTCIMTFDPVGGTGQRTESWKCILTECIDIKNKGCKSEVARDCFDEAIVNATVCSNSIYKHSRFIYSFELTIGQVQSLQHLVICNILDHAIRRNVDGYINIGEWRKYSNIIHL